MKQDVDYFERFHGNVILNIPPKLFRDSKYTGNDILVYGLISALSYKSGYCYASNNTLSKMCHKCSNKTIQNSINKLLEDKLLFKVFKVYRGRQYRLLFTSDIAISENSDIILKNFSKDLNEKKELFDYDWLNDLEFIDDEESIY